MKLKYLLERLDEPVSFEKKETNNKYEFKIGENTYDIKFINMDNQEVIVSFSLIKPGLETDKISGTGNVKKVFSTVVSAIENFIKNKKFQTIWFTSTKEEPSRVKFYKTLYNSPEMKERFPEFKYSKIDEDENFYYFIISKKEIK